MTDATRARVLAAARDTLASSGIEGFTIDRVAAIADVGRMTVYYQFASRQGLLDALLDDVSAARLLEGLGPALEFLDPVEGLAQFVGAFVGFWSADRVVIRRLRGLAAANHEIDLRLRAADEQRALQVKSLVGRLAGAGRIRVSSAADAVDLVAMLTGFEAFDTLATGGRPTEKVAALLMQTAHAVLGLDG